MGDDELFKIQQLKQQGLYRKLLTIDDYDGVFFFCKGRRFLNFGSNSYLNLSHDPVLIASLKDSADQWGVGSQSSRYICGNHVAHEQLEARLAEWLHCESALFFNSGYAANLGVLSSLLNRESFALMDRSCHASLFDGLRLSRASFRVFRHNDMNHLEWCLNRYRTVSKKIWILVESVYSMDGDRCPLKNLVSLKEKYDFRLIVDESHSLGVFGKDGSGLVNETSCQNNIDVRMSGLGKAIGMIGGAVFASRTIIDWIRNKGRSSLFTTAMPVPIVKALSHAIQLVCLAQKKREQLRTLFQKMKGESPIIPFYVNDIHNVLEIAQHFWQKGIFVPAIRFPTVPQRTERLRISLTADHKLQHLKIFKDIWKQWIESQKP